MRLFLFFAAMAACSIASAQSVMISGAAPGYEVVQHDATPPVSGSFTIPGGAAWDTAGPDFYFYDADAQAIRRFDTTTNTPAPTLFDVPNPVFGPYLDSMVVDPFVTSDIYAVESGAGLIYKLRRDGPDSLDPTFGTAGVETGGPYTFYPYDLEFDAFGRLFVTGANFSPAESGVYLINPSTLGATMIVDLMAPGGAPYSGPLAFDTAGDLYVGLPPLTFNPGDVMRIVRFSKSVVDAAINSAGATVLTVADGQIVVDAADAFPVSGSMDFRVENATEVLYFAGIHSADIYRSVLSTRAYTVLAHAASPATNHSHHIAAMAFDSRDEAFRPFSGDDARLLVVMVERDPTFVDVLTHALCIITPDDAPAGIDALEITATPATVANGLAFRLQVELRDSGGLPVSADAGIRAMLHSGSGELGGTTYRIATNGVAIFDDLVLSGASRNVILRFELAGGSAAVNTAALTVAGSGGKPSSSSNGGSDGGCASGHAAHWPVFVGLLGLALVAARLRRRRIA